MQEKILLVDDDVSILLLVSDVLEEKGLEVTAVRSGEEALRRVEEGRFDLILLDIMMKGLSGLEVCRQIRGRVDCPILFLSAKDSVKDIVKGLDLGADDYLTKPFDTKELLARVAVRLRENARSPLAAVYTCGELTLDTASHAVRAAGRPVQLTRTEYAILKLLMQNPGQVLAKSVLLDRISADTPDCTESSLKTHVSNLRGKLRAVSGRDYVEAVWGIGFRLAAES